MHRRFDYLEGKSGSSAAALCGRDAIQLLQQEKAGDINLAAIADRMRGSIDTPVRCNEFMLQTTVAERDRSFEITLFANGRSIIKGTDDPALARTVFAKYVGN